jgi:lipoprotein signal peptidase
VSAGRRLYFPRVVIRFGVVALLALALQLIVIIAPGVPEVLRRGLFVLSYLLLLFFVAANWKRIGIAIIGIGALLNFLAIAANGGLMPVAPENLARIRAEHRVEEIEEGSHVPGTKNVLLQPESTRLRFLSDTLVWDNDLSFFRVFSVGDLFIVGGLVLMLGELLLPRVRRTQDRQPLSATTAEERETNN